eukprot:2143804-Lingulodinium_polyedra.AAC.1
MTLFLINMVVVYRFCGRRGGLGGRGRPFGGCSRSPFVRGELATAFSSCFESARVRAERP